MMRNGHGEFGGISGDTLSWEGVCRHYYIIFEINLHTPVRNARTQRRGYIFKKYKLALKINSASISDATVTRTNNASIMFMIDPPDHSPEYDARDPPTKLGGLNVCSD